ncbi:Streptomycin adenylyltransferase [Lachnospiraceae bacterium NE2001]|nr:Streptomycin adenylyltransferase [Lachnospiraceae bacterium NE2001]
MRTEDEVVDQILKYAEEDDNVRAVIRTDLMPERDYLFTYNFYFIVNDIDKYDDDSVFESFFGDRVLLFRSDKNYPDMFQNTKGHLMVFRDGVTIVINAMDQDTFLSRYNGEIDQENVWIGDTFKKILDKDSLLPDIERLEEKQTLFSDVPTEEAFIGTCNEFWWVIKTFAEYTLREELPSAMFYLNVAIRDLLNKVLRWNIYLQSDQPVDMGILDSKMEELLDEEFFVLYKKTYPSADYKSIWEAYDAVVSLWRRVGNMIAERCDFAYPSDTEKNMLEFIQNLRDMKVASRR